MCLYCFCFSFPMEDRSGIFNVRNFPYLTLYFCISGLHILIITNRTLKALKFTLSFSVYSGEWNYYYFYLFFIFHCQRKKGLSDQIFAESQNAGFQFTWGRIESTPLAEKYQEHTLMFTALSPT